MVDGKPVVLRGVEVMRPSQRRGRPPAAGSAFCEASGLPHLLDPGRVALALGCFPDQEITAVCARCQVVVNITERIRRQETRED